MNIFQLTRGAREHADPRWASRISDHFYGGRPAPTLSWSRSMLCSTYWVDEPNLSGHLIESQSWTQGHCHSDPGGLPIEAVPAGFVVRRQLERRSGNMVRILGQAEGWMGIVSDHGDVGAPRTD